MPEGSDSLNFFENIRLLSEIYVQKNKITFKAHKKCIDNLEPCNNSSEQSWLLYLRVNICPKVRWHQIKSFLFLKAFLTFFNISHTSDRMLQHSTLNRNKWVLFMTCNQTQVVWQQKRMNTSLHDYICWLVVGGSGRGNCAHLICVRILHIIILKHQMTSGRF